MANDLVVVEALRDICITADKFIQTSRKYGYTRKSQKEELTIKINRYLAEERSNAISSIATGNLMHLQSIMNTLNKCEFTGKAYEYAMDQVDLANKKLRKVLEDL